MRSLWVRIGDLQMTILLSKKHIKCVEKGLRVSKNQTVRECQAKHGCDDEACPLRAYLLPEKLEEIMLRNRTA